jgi:hypothetical protein
MRYFLGLVLVILIRLLGNYEERGGCMTTSYLVGVATQPSLTCWGVRVPTPPPLEMAVRLSLYFLFFSFFFFLFFFFFFVSNKSTSTLKKKCMYFVKILL